jgi:hypothetical protein
MPAQKGDQFLQEPSTQTDGSKDIKLLSGLMRDYHLIQQIDYDDDPQGFEALKKIDFNNRGAYFPKKEFISNIDAVNALELSKKKINRIIEQGRNKHVTQFT